MKRFFSPPFMSVSPFLPLNLARWQRYAYAIALFTRPEIKSWPDVKTLCSCAMRFATVFPGANNAAHAHTWYAGGALLGSVSLAIALLPWVPEVFFFPVVCGENWAEKPRSWRAGKNPSGHGSYASHFHEYSSVADWCSNLVPDLSEWQWSNKNSHWPNLWNAPQEP